MKKDKVSESKAKIHKQQKPKPKQKVMLKRKRWDYKDIEKFRKYFESLSPSTAHKNARRLLHYCTWANVTPEDLIKLYKETPNKKEWQRDRTIEIQTFYNHLRKERYSINSARNIPSGITKFYTLYCETVRGIVKKFDRPQLADNEFILTQEDLRKVYYYSDLEGRTLLSLAVCLGYASVDFLHLDTEKLKYLVQEATDKGLEFIQFIGKTRQKTSIQPRTQLTPEAIHNLKEYLEVIEKKYGYLPEYLFNITNQGLNKKIRGLFEKANIELYGKSLTFHLFRKYLYTMLQKYNPDIAKVITAHTVSLSDITYIQDLNAECFRVFKESYKLFALNCDLTGKKNKKQAEINKKLEKALQSVEGENNTLKTRVDMLQKDLKKQKLNLEEFTNLIEEKTCKFVKEYNYVTSKFANLRLARKYNLPEWQEFLKSEECQNYLKEQSRQSKKEKKKKAVG